MYQIENTEYNQKHQPASSSGQGNDAETSQSLSTNLERDAETNKIVLKNDSSLP